MAGEWGGGRAGAMDGGGVRGAEAECEPAGSPGTGGLAPVWLSIALSKSAGGWR
jgi:hypothetical protein